MGALSKALQSVARSSSPIMGGGLRAGDNQPACKHMDLKQNQYIVDVSYNGKHLESREVWADSESAAMRKTLSHATGSLSTQISQPLGERRVLAERRQIRNISLPDWTPNGGTKVRMTSGKFLVCRCGSTQWHKDNWSGDLFCLSCRRQH
jgi:hypothetical protein